MEWVLLQSCLKAFLGKGVFYYHVCLCLSFLVGYDHCLRQVS